MTQYALLITAHQGLSGAATPAPNLDSSGIQFWFGGVKETRGERRVQEAL